MACRYNNGRHLFIRRGNFLRKQRRYFDSCISQLSSIDTKIECHPELLMHSNDLSASVCSSSTIKIHDLLQQGCLSYSKTWAYQQVILNRRLEQRRMLRKQSVPTSNRDQDCVVMSEHSPVYTMGRGANELHLTFLNSDSSAESPFSNYSASAVSKKLSRKVRGPGTARLSIDRRMEDRIKNMMNTKVNDANNDADGEGDEQSMLDAIEKLTESISPVVAPNGVPIYRVDRGGEVTFHGPSQLVVYPMFDLKNGSSYKQDLHWYLRMIEEVVIQTLGHYNIDGKRDDINTGVWVGGNKIAAIGISSSRWITTHGFALNVDPDLSYFDTSIILPCGIEGRGVTSMGNILRDRSNERVPSIVEVAAVVTRTMEQVFKVRILKSE